jgi:tetratricopeptide (TPR) repeat protein
MSTGPQIAKNGRIGRYVDTGAIVAVKIFQSGPERAPDVSVKLRDREVRMLQSVQHPNIVKFRDSGEEGDSYFFAMEFVENSLLKCMRRGTPFELADRVLLLRQTASALAAIHHQGIVHRDIKPGNILLDHDPGSTVHAKLTDLGIAKNVSETDIVHEQMPTRVPGTPKYLSPEQIRLQAVDGRADIFSLGVVAYELLTGTTPFRADSTEGYLKANAEQTQLPAREIDGSLPDFLSEMVDRMLVKDREERYDSDTLARDLELVQQHLISGAPMVERTNPASLFYKPVARKVQRRGARTQAVAPTSWGLAAAFALVGLLTTVTFWPAAAPNTVSADGAAATDAEALRQETRAALAAGQNWRALAAARALDELKLSADESEEAERLAEQAQDAAAEPYRAAVARMLAEDRQDEAQIAVRRMQELMPQARATAALTAALSRREPPPTGEDGWQTALQETYSLVRDHRYVAALGARKALLVAAGADAGRVAAVRRAIGDLFDHWCRYLLSGYPVPDTVEEFFRVLDENADVLEDGPQPAALGNLHLKLARVYRDKGMYEHALTHYEAAAGSPDVAEEADKARNDLVRWLAGRPQDAATFAATLAQEGFAGSLWDAENAGGATQRVTDGTLVLDAPAGEGARAARRETARPIRNLGFACNVEFRTSEAVFAQPGAARLGVAVASSGKDTFEMAFDGRSYVATVRRGPTQGAAGAAVHDPIGDEAHAWHSMGLAYDYDTGQLGVLLDGTELRRYAVNLGDVRIRVFLEADAGAQAQAFFRSISFKPRGSLPSPAASPTAAGLTP